MNLFIAYVFPVLLAAGAIYLMTTEIKNHRKTAEDPGLSGNRKFRFAKRIIGSVLVLIMAGMILWGMMTMPHPAKTNLNQHLFYWSVVLGLVAVVIGLAFWDVIDGIKQLENFIEQTSISSTKNLNHMIKEYNRNTGAGEIKNENEP